MFPKPSRRAHRGPIPPEFRTRRNADIMIMRSIISFLGSWQHCNADCRRHKRCASPTVECFDLNRDTIHQTLIDIVDWSRFDGPREEAELDELVTDQLFD